MQDDYIEIGADGVDVAAVVEDVRRAVEEKRARGLYAERGLDKLPVLEIKELKDNSEVLRSVVSSMDKSAMLDIGDFLIVSKGGVLGRLEASVKKALWKMLRFYTYRMFTQQREFNLQVVAVLDAMLQRLSELEGDAGTRGSSS